VVQEVVELEGRSLWRPREGEEITDIAVAWGPCLGFTERNLENGSDMSNPIFQLKGGEI
jgi:hypothetical protein